jgi:flagellar basal-body rod protein FlgB
MKQFGRGVYLILTMNAARFALSFPRMAKFAEAFMIHDLSTFAALKQRMRFLQSRQKVLADNVANADTPGFKPKDIAQIGIDPATRGSDAARRMSAAAYGKTASLTVTSPMHIDSAGKGQGTVDRGATYETRPSGNAVNLEDEMLKVSQNQVDFQTAANLYQRGLSTLKTALGRRA